MERHSEQTRLFHAPVLSSPMSVSSFHPRVRGLKELRHQEDTLILFHTQLLVITQAIGTKFLVAPWFEILVNGERLKLEDVEGLQSEVLKIDPHGEVVVHRIDATAQDRTTRLRGITWWVNKRMVGQPSWCGLDERGAILDGRTILAKRCSFIVEADVLRDHVKADWSGFFENQRSLAISDTVRAYVMKSLDELLSGYRKNRKKTALAEHRKVLGYLSKHSRRAAGQFTEDLLRKCPSLSQGDLSRAIEVFASLEQARSGYELLTQLAACSPDDGSVP